MSLELLEDATWARQVLVENRLVCESLYIL